ncbi:MAG: HDIG domain-containing metalloprotein [Cyanobacteria bacterium J06642_12]
MASLNNNKSQGVPKWLAVVGLRGDRVARMASALPWIKNGAGYIFAIALLTAAHGIRFYNEPRLAAGQVAPETIAAPADATIIDTAETARERAEIRDTVQILQLNLSANAAMDEALQQQISTADSIRTSLGTLPYISTATLTTDVQVYLRQLPDDEWDIVRIAADNFAAVTLANPEAVRAAGALQELSRETTPPDVRSNYELTLNEIEAAQSRYRDAVVALAGSAWSPELLRWTQAEWDEARQALPTVLRRIQALGVPRGLPRDIEIQGIQGQLEPYPEAIAAGVKPVLVNVVRPNLDPDPERTEDRIQRRLDALPPVTVDVTKGDPIVRSGDTISQLTFDSLDHFDLTQRRLNLGGLLQVAGIIVGGIAIVLPLQTWLRPNLRTRDRCLLLLLWSTVAPTAIVLGVPSTSLPAVGLLSGSYYGGWVGLLLVVVAAALLPLATGTSVAVIAPTLIPILTGSLLACAIAPRLRSREELALLGGGAALTQAFVFAIVPLALGNPVSWMTAAIAGGSGLLWSIVALGASPNLEPLFDLVTPIRLAELANPNRPLLRRLAEEAPGTYQHTLFVTSLAERAAQKLNLNAELVRTGTLYHDIGKMVRAQYFIENQMGGPNLHDEVNDPFTSAQIIIDHVRDGIKLARQYRLPTAIRAFIPEHQGTIRVAFFLHQAKMDAASGEEVDESLFRYDGPIPQTRETGVVMLADACEAALRSLRKSLAGDIDSTSVEEARKTILSIFRSRWQDGQLKDSGLLREEMDLIADVFLQVWRESYHERIPYPSATLPSTNPV